MVAEVTLSVYQQFVLLQKGPTKTNLLGCYTTSELTKVHNLYRDLASLLPASPPCRVELASCARPFAMAASSNTYRCAKVRTYLVCMTARISHGICPIGISALCIACAYQINYICPVSYLMLVHARVRLQSAHAALRPSCCASFFKTVSCTSVSVP